MKNLLLFTAMALLSAGLGPFVARAADERNQSLMSLVLLSHNQERAQRGEQPLVWSEKLSAEAKRYADELAREGKFAHASFDEREGAGENLWRGTQNRFRINDMMGAFLEEKRHFKSGTFPDNSVTGNWSQVGHYTQIIWPTTQEVGCALSAGKGDDYLVCRYWPAGNRVGVMLR